MCLKLCCDIESELSLKVIFSFESLLILSGKLIGVEVKGTESRESITMIVKVEVICLTIYEQILPQFHYRCGPSEYRSRRVMYS